MTSPFLYTRLTTAPLFNSRNVPETPLNTGKSSNSWASTESPLSAAPCSSFCPRTFLFVRAPVGQDTMHSPQETEEEPPIAKSASNEIAVAAPFPFRANTKLWRIPHHPCM